jgi:hypothetical protein
MTERYQPWMYDTVNDWFYQHKGDSIPEPLLAKTGFIVPGVAVGFLIQTDTDVCFLEPFISNPKASKELRQAGLAAIVDALEHEASRLGYRFVYGVATAPTMIEHGIGRGWVDMGDHKVIAKELK